MDQQMSVLDVSVEPEFAANSGSAGNSGSGGNCGNSGSSSNGGGGGGCHFTQPR